MEIDGARTVGSHRQAAGAVRRMTFAACAREELWRVSSRRRFLVRRRRTQASRGADERNEDPEAQYAPHRKSRQGTSPPNVRLVTALYTMRGKDLFAFGKNVTRRGGSGDAETRRGAGCRKTSRAAEGGRGAETRKGAERRGRGAERRRARRSSRTPSASLRVSAPLLPLRLVSVSAQCKRSYFACSSSWDSAWFGS